MKPINNKGNIKLATTYLKRIREYRPEKEKIAKRCWVWRKFGDSPEQVAGEGGRFLKEVRAEVWGD